jgi:Ca-activated chloride channel family protein
MIFLKSSLWPWLVLGFLVVSIALLWSEQRFFNWVQEHWFLKRRLLHVFSSLGLLVGFTLLAVVLMDPRSGEIKIKGKVRQDKTIILIDTSTSMLVEDVRPNRLEKAVLVAKHFVRKAVGHEVSIMVFADITKKLVPFTSDLDLLDARLDSIRMLRNMNAGSSIGIAIEEAVQYFDPKDSGVSGNILVITDGEDNADTEAFKVPEGINLALVGVGTKAGGPIPLKDSYGMFYGQKKSQGVTVISKLNEEFFLNAVRDQKNAKFFSVQSYDLPTNLVLDFFSRTKGEEKEGENLIRPVALEIWCIPALLILAFAYGLRFFKPFILVFCLLLTGVRAQDKQEAPEIPPEIQNKIQQLKDGSLDREERINLADQLVKIRMHDMAQRLYEENLNQEDVKERPESYFNWATSELETGKIDSALQRYEELESSAKKNEINEDLIQRMRANIKRAIVPPPKQDKKEKKDEKKDQEENKDQKESGGEGKGEESKGGQSKENKSGKTGNSQEKEGDKNPFDPKNKDKGEKDKQDQGKDKSDRGDRGEKEEKDQDGKPEDGQEREKKKAKAKLSPLLEQLKQDDRILQLKLLDTSTQKRTDRKKKDW